MKRRMVKRLRQLNLTGPRDMFGAIQQAFDTCCAGPATPTRSPPTGRIPP
jgi:hypothetical protein